MNVLVIDVGGSNVKLAIRGSHSTRRFASDRSLFPEQLVRQVHARTKDWPVESIVLGYPGRVGPTGPSHEPGNLGTGWVGFDFSAAFGHRVLIVNDAVMQAVGAYRGGRMLFLGLGTGLGSALVSDRVVVPLELGQLRLASDNSLFDQLGKEGYDRNGPGPWNDDVRLTVKILRDAFSAEDVVLGGGNARLVTPLPKGCRRGGNHDAFAGGYRLWDDSVVSREGFGTGPWQVLK